MNYKDKALEHVRGVCPGLRAPDKIKAVSGDIVERWHTPHLEHWLRGTKKSIYRHSVQTHTDTIAIMMNDHKKVEVAKYDLTKDEQSEEFYKAYCEIVGV